MREAAEIAVETEMSKIFRRRRRWRQTFDHASAKHESTRGAPNPALGHPAAPPSGNMKEAGDVHFLHPERRGGRPTSGMRQIRPGRSLFEGPPFLMPVTCSGEDLSGCVNLDQVGNADRRGV